MTIIFYMIYLKVWNIKPKGESFAKFGFMKIEYLISNDKENIMREINEKNSCCRYGSAYRLCGSRLQQHRKTAAQAARQQARLPLQQPPVVEDMGNIDLFRRNDRV